MVMRYIREIYTDDYNTLKQAIIIDCYLDAQSNGLHSKCLRHRINPNLHLYLVEHIDENGDIIYAKKLSRVI